MIKSFKEFQAVFENLNQFYPMGKRNVKYFLPAKKGEVMPGFKSSAAY